MKKIILIIALLSSSLWAKFDSININGTQIVCMPELNKVIVSGEDYSIPTQKALSSLQKDETIIYNNLKHYNLFSAIGDFKYECRLSDENTIRVEVEFVNKIANVLKDYLNRDVYKWTPNKYPKNKDYSWQYTHTLKLYKNNTLIADIDRFNGSGSYIRGGKKITTNGMRVDMEYLVFMYDSDQDNYSISTATMVFKPDEPITKDNQLITYKKLLSKDYNFWVGYKRTTGYYRVLKSETKFLCHNNKIKGKKWCEDFFNARKYFIEQMGLTLEDYRGDKNGK